MNIRELSTVVLNNPESHTRQTSKWEKVEGNHSFSLPQQGKKTKRMQIFHGEIQDHVRLVI